MRKLFVALVTLVSLMAVGQDGRKMDGNSLLRNCKAAVSFYDKTSTTQVNADNVGAPYCVGVVHGVRDVLEVTIGLEVPTGITVEQSIRIVTRYLEDHPEELADRDSQLVMQALVGAFPKKKP